MMVRPTLACTQLAATKHLMYVGGNAGYFWPMCQVLVEEDLHGEEVS